MTVRAKGVTVAATLSDNLKRVLDGKAFVTLATIQPDGSPQASPVWVKRDDGQLLMSTTIRRRKYQNLTRDPRATVVVIDHDQPYRYAQLRGTVELTRDGADVTDAYRRGADHAVALARATGAQSAVLKARSPSCGCGQVYDGEFAGRIVEGDGVTAAALKAAGVSVGTEEEVAPPAEPRRGEPTWSGS